jgi:hypothetical protein
LRRVGLGERNSYLLTLSIRAYVIPALHSPVIPVKAGIHEWHYHDETARPLHPGQPA